MTRPSFTPGKLFSENKYLNINILLAYPLLDGCLMASAVAPLVRLRT